MIIGHDTTYIETYEYAFYVLMRMICDTYSLIPILI